MPDIPNEDATAAVKSALPPIHPPRSRSTHKFRLPFLTVRKAYGMKTLCTMVICHWLLKGFVHHGMWTPVAKYYWRLKNTPSTEIALNHTLAMLGGALKPIVAILSDVLPLGGYNKRWYLTISGIAASAASLTVSLVSVRSMPDWGAVVCFFLVLSHVFFTDVLTEGVFARRIRQCPSASADLYAFGYFGNFLCQAAARLCSGLILQKTGQDFSSDLVVPGAQICFLCSAPVLLVSTLMGAVNLIEEERVTAEEARTQRHKVLYGQPELLLIAVVMAVSVLVLAFSCKQLGFMGAAVLVSCLIVLCVGLCRLLLRPILGQQIVFKAIFMCCGIISVDSAAYYFYTDTPEQFPDGPHFSPFFYVTVLGSVGSSLGALAAGLYGVTLKKLTFREAYCVLTPVGTLCGLINILVFLRVNRDLGISDHLFMLGDEVVVNVVRVLSMIPGTLIVSQCAPNRLESSVIGVMQGVVALSLKVKGPVEAFICDSLGVRPRGAANESSQFTYLWLAGLITAGLHVVPIFFTYLVPNTSQSQSLIPAAEQNDPTSVTNGSPWKRLTRKSVHS